MRHKDVYATAVGDTTKAYFFSWFYNDGFVGATSSSQKFVAETNSRRVQGHLGLRRLPGQPLGPFERVWGPTCPAEWPFVSLQWIGFKD